MLFIPKNTTLLSVARSMDALLLTRLASSARIIARSSFALMWRRLCSEVRGRRIPVPDWCASRTPSWKYPSQGGETQGGLDVGSIVGGCPEHSTSGGPMSVLEGSSPGYPSPEELNSVTWLLYGSVA